MQNKQISDLQINIPEGQPILYTSGVFINANKLGVVLNFAQQVGPTNQQIVVSRVGMSVEHAKILAKRIEELIKQGEGKVETSKNIKNTSNVKS